MDLPVLAAAIAASAPPHTVAGIATLGSATSIATGTASLCRATNPTFSQFTGAERLPCVQHIRHVASRVPRAKLLVLQIGAASHPPTSLSVLGQRHVSHRCIAVVVEYCRAACGHGERRVPQILVPALGHIEISPSGGQTPGG